MHPDPWIDRRGLLRGAGLLGAGVLAGGLVGCTRAAQPSRPEGSGSPSPAGPSSSVQPPSASISPGQGSPSTSDPLPTSVPWAPDPGDLDPTAKLMAARVVEAIGSWHDGAGTTAAAADRLRRQGFSPALARTAGPLLGGQRGAVLRVVETQYGGLLSSTASVLVVCEQHRSGQSGATPAGTTVDVRLTRTRAGWGVTALNPGVPGAAQRPVAELARRVLSNRRIRLPPAAAGDVASGAVHDSVLRAMLVLADDYRIGVSVVRSGHPTYVFGTTRTSDHAVGRAFDTWWVDRHAVVHPSTPLALVTRYMHSVAAAGAYNIGGPRLLDGAGFFTDDTHHDHVHAGFAS